MTRPRHGRVFNELQCELGQLPFNERSLRDGMLAKTCFVGELRIEFGTGLVASFEIADDQTLRAPIVWPPRREELYRAAPASRQSAQINAFVRSTFHP